MVRGGWGKIKLRTNRCLRLSLKRQAAFLVRGDGKKGHSMGRNGMSKEREVRPGNGGEMKFQNSKP